MKNSMMEELGDQPLFICCFKYLLYFMDNYLNPLFIIIVITNSYYCRYILNTDLLISLLDSLETTWGHLTTIILSSL